LKPQQYYIIYKPFQVLSQFSTQENKKTLANYFSVAKDIYPVGRLDYDSEGLLILTNDKSLNQKLLHPTNKHIREYWVQVEGTITNEALTKLSTGVEISIDGKKYTTNSAKAHLLIDPVVCERNPPIRFRKNVSTSWLSLQLTEGKNRQVRKMTASVGFPTLRLIRNRIESIELNNMQPGDIISFSKSSIYKKLFNEQ
jgi:23S rRNA pseudouridine2457 synthase